MPGKTSTRWTVSLRISILSIFIVTLATVVSVVVFHTYTRNREAALAASAALMDEVGEKTLERLKWLYEPAYALVDVSTEIAGTNGKPDLATHPLDSALLRAMELRPTIKSAYLGFSDGDFYRIWRVDDADELPHAPPETRFSILRIMQRSDGSRFSLHKYLDHARRPVGSRLVPVPRYDPRGRPWYKMASRLVEAHLSDLYVFAGNGTPGVTVAKRFDGPTPGVFGVDIELEEIAGFLARQRFTESALLFMFHSDGRLAVHPEPTKLTRAFDDSDSEAVEFNTVEALGDPIALAVVDEFRSLGTGFERRILNVRDAQYVARVDDLPDRYGRDVHLAIVAPVNEIVAPVLAAGRSAVLFGAAVFILFLPILVWIASRISRPLARLSSEADQIRRIELDDPLELRSLISEIADLSDAMAAMKSTLAAFTRYIPKTLVARMIESGVVPQLGGERRDVTLMFTDAADFTAMSDTMEPELLAKKISHYLEALGSEILKLGGTIDKYLGDGIMAFWNAPIASPDHARDACEAALRCARQSGDLNAGWVAAGEAPMPTRIGIHTGEAIVGNIGSADRMDYTAMGGAVNLASRLEGLNKVFGTRILVSASVKEAAGDGFLFRALGRVVPKGRREATGIYELIGRNPACARTAPSDAATGEQADYCEDWNSVFMQYLDRNWSVAVEGFSRLAERRADDLAAQFYLRRAQEFLESPPGPDWWGIEAFDTK